MKIAGAASVLCSILGTAILIAVILLMMSLFLPRLVGYKVYNVVSGSMEPAIPPVIVLMHQNTCVFSIKD